jgi:hypothetical protein
MGLASSSIQRSLAPLLIYILRGGTRRYESDEERIGASAN